MKQLFSLFALLLAAFVLKADGGYRISIDIDGYDRDTLFIAYHYGDKQYIKDTIAVGKDREFVFAGAENLPGGIYLVVMAPDNQFFQILVDEDDQVYSVHTSKANPVGDIQFKGSKDNELFYTYMNYLTNMRPRAEKINAALEAAKDEKEKEDLNSQIELLNREVEDFQMNIIRNNPGTLTAAIIKANLPMDYPEFKGDENEVRTLKWRYTQRHYFDNLDLGYPNMMRTPFLFQRIDYFINKLTVQHPDTIAWAIDLVLEKAKPSEETFKYYVIHFLNEYAKSKVVGMDAVYVHLVDTYYRTGQAGWTEEEQLQKILENADVLRPLLIGKIAPDLSLQKKDGTKISLHEVDSDYTILYFWRYDCGHCKKSTPFMKAFYENFKDKGVKILALCAKYTDEVPACWDYIEENEIQDWIHTVDPYGLSKYAKIYDLKSTPQIYILDRNMEILSKKIGAEQLEEVMDKIIEMKQLEKQEQQTPGSGK